MESIVASGIDIESIERFAPLSSKEGFLRRVFTPGELAYSCNKRAPHRHLAGRFAAKEACMKALGTGLSGGIRWRDVEVVVAEDGRPGLRLHSTAKKSLGPGRAFLSITYSGELAVALVVIEKQQGENFL